MDIICPYYCMGCGRLGNLLCCRCKKYVMAELLGDVTEKKTGVMYCGTRKGLLFEMVKKYKYQSVRGLGRVLAGLIDEVLPDLGEKVVVVPLPTIARHVRGRGFDHMEILARELVRRRGWEFKKMLGRTNSTVQVGASEEVRKKQAQTAYALDGRVEDGCKYLLIDDVWTTGASMMAAEEILRRAGARRVYKAVVVVSGD
ncbi:ComF family protein [Candidatus Saccharibacteria bacterium]|nr:ComF family protein [Candidatus Saccharibacteria bacterium]